MASLGTELALTFSTSGRKLWFQVVVDNSSGNFTLGDYSAHDHLPIGEDTIETHVIYDGKIVFYMKSGRALSFSCALPNEVAEGDTAVTYAFNEALTEPDEYTRIEAIYATICDQMNLVIPTILE